jgi:hypothetical protein
MVMKGKISRHKPPKKSVKKSKKIKKAVDLSQIMLALSAVE